MLLNIKNLTGKNIKIEVEGAHCTVGFVKSVIEELEDDVQVSQIRLIFNGKVLNDGQTLESYKIQNDATIHILVKNSQMEIFVKSLVGRTITLKVELSFTIEKIKDMLEAEGIKMHKNTLTFAGTKLNHNGYLLSDYGITNYSTLHIE